MKTATLRTLGAAALGAAFAAAAAGTASAAPLSTGTPATALDSLATQFPVGQVSHVMPGGQQAAGTVRGVLHHAPGTLDRADGGGMLGGLPVRGTTVGNVDGVPLG